jgi:two-component system phosphate regulon response regulator OmpR
MVSRDRTGSRPRILVVEDNSRIRELESEALTQLNYDVGVAASVDEASNLLNEASWDLLMTDVHLTGLSNGIELARSAKRRKRQLKTLIVGGDLDELRSTDFRGIADATLKKPFTVTQLQEAVAALIQSTRERA